MKQHCKFRLLREDGSMAIRGQLLDIYIAAGSVNTSVQLLCCFSFHEDEKIRSRVAENKRLPAVYLEQLACDEAPEVRISVADNPNTAVEVLELLAQDQHPDVRYSIAENANAPCHLLEVLEHDENPYIASRAKKTLKKIRWDLFHTRNCA
jgi:hypothetical protein